MILFLTAALSLVSSAVAAPTARDLSGQVVSLEAGTVLAFWSLADPESSERLRQAEAAAQWLGVDVIAVDMDLSSSRSLLTPWLRSQGIGLRTVPDPTGELRARFQGRAGDLVVLGAELQVVARVTVEGSGPGLSVALARAIGREDTWVVAGR